MESFFSLHNGTVDVSLHHRLCNRLLWVFSTTTCATASIKKQGSQLNTFLVFRGVNGYFFDYVFWTLHMDKFNDIKLISIVI